MRGIYSISHGGRVAYVGCSLVIKRRFTQHLNRLRAKKHRNFLLQRLWSKYPESLEFSVLEQVADDHSLALKEQWYIDRLSPWANLASANGSFLHSEEARAKMRGRKVSEETRRRLREAKKGKPSGRKGIETNRIPVSAFKKGLIPWNKGVIGYSTRQKGRPHSIAHRLALSAAKIGKPRPDISLKLQGRKQSPEVIAKRVSSFMKTINERSLKCLK